MQLPVAAPAAQIGPAACVTHAAKAAGPAFVLFGYEAKITQATVIHTTNLEVEDNIVVNLNVN
jgi:hypothetical protein